MEGHAVEDEVSSDQTMGMVRLISEAGFRSLTACDRGEKNSLPLQNRVALEL